LGLDIVNVFPVMFPAVGLAVLFLRREDPNAWLLALMFAGTISIAEFSRGEQVDDITLVVARCVHEGRTECSNRSWIRLRVLNPQIPAGIGSTKSAA